MRVFIVAPSAASTYGDSRLTRDLIKHLKSRGHHTTHLAIGHKYTEESPNTGETFTTLKSHAHCCGIPDPILEVQDGIEMGGLIIRQGIPEHWEPERPCLHGKLIPDDIAGYKTFPFLLTHLRPELVITVGHPVMAMLASATPLRGSYKHIHYALPETKQMPTSLNQGITDNSVATALNRADLIVTNTDAAALALRRVYGLSNPVKVIPEGIDTDIFARLPNEVVTRVKRTNPSNLLKYNKDGSYVLDSEDLNETFNILSIGQNSERKNIPRLLETVDRLRHTYKYDKPVRLILHVPANGGDEGWDIPLLIEQYKAWDWVYVHYQYTDTFALDDRALNALFNIADLYLSLSSAESWGTAAMQALAADIPVVQTQLPTNESVFGNAVKLVPAETSILKPGSHVTWLLPSVNEAVEAVNDVLSGNFTYEDSLRSVARQYDWSFVGRLWDDVMNETLSPGIQNG
jgi:glycosyltransferase involved in cell wall biosynthesis